MKFFARVRSWGRGWLRSQGERKYQAKRPPAVRWPTLFVERLEDRTLLTSRPTASVFIGATPLPNGSILTTPPTSLNVVFSEDVTGAGLSSNYTLVDNSGNSYAVTASAYNMATHTETLTLPASAILAGRTYTLLIEGDNIKGNTSGLTMSQPGQLVVANSQTNNTSIINLPGNGSLQALANYPIPSLNPSTSSPDPIFAAARDLNGDGIADLIVADSASGTVNIYLGQGNGIFDLTPDLTLNMLATNTTTAAPSAMAVTTVKGAPMIVVADSGTGQVSVFLESSASSMTFSATYYACGAGPSGMVLTDINQDGLPDIAVSNSTGVAVTNGTNYTVNVLLATAPGAYAAATAFNVGSNNTSTTPATLSGVTSPTGIAAGDLNNDNAPDLAVSGSNGNIGVLLNTTAAKATTPTFTSQNVVNNISGTTSSVAIGKIDSSSQNDIIAETSGLASNGPIVFQNAGGANFGAAGTGAGGVPLYPAEFAPFNPVSPGPNPGAFVLDPNSGTGLNDLLIANNSSTGSVTYVKNTSFNNSISKIDKGPVTGNYVIHTPSVAGLSNGMVVMITGDTTGSGINGVWKIANVKSSGAGSPSFEIPVAWVADQSANLGNWYAVSFSTAFTTTPVDANPDSIAFVDINNDNKPDLLTGNAKNGDVTVALGLGGGKFQTATDITLAPPSTPATASAVAVGDLNADGIPDLAIADSNNNEVWVLLGNGDGTYKSPVGYTTLAAPNSKGVVLGHAPVALTLANLGGNGLDIVTVSQTDDVVSILANNGSGVFAKPTTYSVTASPVQGQTPTAIVAGNFGFSNNANDLAVGYQIAGSNDGGVSILLGVAGQADKFTYPNYTSVQPPIAGIAVSALATGNFTNTVGELDLAVAGSTNQSPGNVQFYYPKAGSGGFFTEKFTVFQAAAAGAFNDLPTISGLAVGDVNRDGYADVVAVSNSTSTSTDNVFVLLNTAGGGFSAYGQDAAVPQGTGLQSVAIMDVPGNAFPNLIVSTTGQGIFRNDNVIVVPNSNANANGDQNLLFGYLNTPYPYQVGSGGQPTAPPSYLTVVSDPFQPLTSFILVGTTIPANVLVNGGFSLPDLSGEKGSLDGWRTFDELNSHGAWAIQKAGSVSPMSATAVLAGFGKKGQYNAMLDQVNTVPYLAANGNPNAASTYEGTHVLYQDITLPSLPPVGGSIKLSLNLYIDNSEAGQWNTDTTLDYALSDSRLTANQQVRVDIVDPTDTNLLDVGSGVLQSIFATNSKTGTAPQILNLSADLSGLVTANSNNSLIVRLRIAAVNNRGRLIVGVNNVQANSVFSDTVTPVLTGLALRNPGFTLPGSTVPNTSDPTLIGNISDLGSVNAIQYIQFDLNNGAPSSRIQSWDAQGNFAFTLPVSVPAQYTVTVTVKDLAGNTTSSALTFNYEGATLHGWTAAGPQAINVSGAGVSYSNVSGRVTSTVVAPFDPTGNTYYVGAANGGVWVTTNGGNSWTPLTDFVTDANGNPLPVSVGGLAISQLPSRPKVIYAGTGIGDLAPDSSAGVGVFKSLDGGLSWSLAGNSGTVLGGARISKMGINANNPDIVYAAVASGGLSGAGVYETTDGGKTWANVLQQALSSGHMYNAIGVAIPTNLVLPSVTDLVVDPFNSSDILIGLGNIGLVKVAGTNIAGLWKSFDGGITWHQYLGNITPNIPGDGLPSGAAVGRVTIAEGSGRARDEDYYYLLIGNPPPANPISNGFVNYGSGIQATTANGLTAGLYRSKNGGLDWTHVMLKQNVSPSTPPHDFEDINMLANQASNVGSLLVDPTDPYRVFVGGSSVTPGGSGPNGVNSIHGMLMVDTSDMRDTTYVDSYTGKIVNDGDDIQKVLTVEALNLPTKGYPTTTIYYDPGTQKDPYKGEGVYYVDLEFGNTGRQLPSGVHTLAFDQTGRLLVGNDSGIWRGSDLGFGYSFTSLGGGIITTASLSGVTGPGFRLTSLNGNLQISELTSAAVDPTNPALVYAAAYNTGVSASVGQLSWLTSSLTGPLTQTNGNLNVPTAAAVTTVLPVPTAAPGTPGTVFLAWAYENALAQQPQISTNAGHAFQNYSIGINPNDSANFLPPLAVSTTAQLSSGRYQYAVLYGTSRIYQSLTTSNLWNDLAGRTLSSQGGLVTAAAFAAGINPYGYYIGTNLGEVFVNIDAGSLNFPMRVNGLPTPSLTNPIPVNGIATDPINRGTAYLVLGGTATKKGHVFTTTDGGLNWNNVTGNLPDVSMNAIVFDARTIGGAFPSGRLYVGTDVGVYLSVDGGTSWQRLGVGLPNVAVTDLQFSASDETLVAATKGRGAFTISTDVTGPRVIHVTQPVVAGTGQHSVTITFSKSIDYLTLPLSSILLTGPSGAGTVNSVVDVTPAGVKPHTVFQITFADQAALGSYALSVGPNVTDLIDASADFSYVGNKMDQNQNGVQGETPGDTFTTHFYLNTLNAAVPAITGMQGSGSNLWTAIASDTSMVPTTNWETPDPNVPGGGPGNLDPTVPWKFVMTGNFTGSGLNDIAAWNPITGVWWVGVSNGTGYYFRPWTTWSTQVTWVDVHAADFTGDGLTDIEGRVLQSSQWWVSVSNGSSFTSSLFATWSTQVTWVDVNVGDFNGDGKTDIVGRALEDGSWWVGESTGAVFNTIFWTRWSTAVTWINVQVGDVTGDGKSDILGMEKGSGKWWASITSGSGALGAIVWAQWSGTANWSDVHLVDLNGDGKLDLVGREGPGSGNFWAALTNSTGSGTLATTLWAQFSSMATWVDPQFVDLNGDGKVDLVARSLQDGDWWAGYSDGTRFSLTKKWAHWSPMVNWMNVVNSPQI